MGAIRSEQPKGKTLTGRGIGADRPLNPTKCHFSASWYKECDTVHTHVHAQIHKMDTYIYTKPNYTASQKYVHSDTKLSCEVLIKKSQTFVGTGHPFEVISKCRLASNQVREYPHLRRGHMDVNRFRDGRITPNMQSDLSPQYFIVLS